VTETIDFPPSPVIGAAAGTQAVTVTQNSATAVETVTQLAQATPVEQAAQVAMAVPAPAQVPAQVPAAAGPPPGDGTSLMQGQVFRDCDNCPDLVVVVPPQGLPPEQVARVKRPADAPPLTAYALGRFEITFDDWARCMAGGGCAALPEDEGWGRNTRPVINVSHEDAVAQYIAWLSRMTGATYRLPTAQEWDFAEAGGGIAMATGVPLIVAQTICASGNYATAAAASSQEAGCADGFPTTAPVGSLKANALGLTDMRGNVWEWVDDCWTPGFTYKVKDSERDCRKRLLRGGAWTSRASLSATPPRGFEDAKRTAKTIGFRVARSLP
jgi:formylglycine-generating enzyme required for sulfatase activity